MADAGEHLGALPDLAADALAHLDEGGGGLAHLARALGLEVGDVAALAERFGGLGEAADGPHLLAQEEDRDAEQQRRSADHPQNDDVDRRGEQPLARRREVHHAVGELDADRDVVGIGRGVDAEGPAQIVGKRVVKRVLEDPGPGRGGDAAHADVGLEARLDRPAFARLLEHEEVVVRVGEVAAELDHRGDLARQREREPPADALPMVREQDIARDELHDDDRHREDQQRAAEQRSRNELT